MVKNLEEIQFRINACDEELQKIDEHHPYKQVDKKQIVLKEEITKVSAKVEVLEQDYKILGLTKNKKDKLEKELLEEYYEYKEMIKHLVSERENLKEDYDNSRRKLLIKKEYYQSFL